MADPPAEIEQIRARHTKAYVVEGGVAHCSYCHHVIGRWPCDASLLLAALSEAEAERDHYQAELANDWKGLAKTLRAEVASLTAIRERAEQIANGPSEQEGLVALRILGAAPSPEPPPECGTTLVSVLSDERPRCTLERDHGGPHFYPKRGAVPAPKEEWPR